MDKIIVTQQQRDNALYARDIMWPRIKPEQVIERLSDYRCGTQACFAGHISVDPYFQAMGVYPSVTGAPRLRGTYGRPQIDTAEYLFGDEWLYAYAGGHDADEPGFTDHELVTRRLNWIIENSEVGNV